MNFLKTTVIGGLVFLVPLVVLGLVIGKAIGVMLIVAEPMASFLPVDSIGGVALANLIALACIVLICFLAGLLANEAGEAGLARTLWDRAQAGEPEILRRKHDEAVRLTEAGRYEEAIALLGEVLAAEPEHAPSLFNIGRALMLAGRPAEAIDPLERGLRLKEDALARRLLAEARKESP